MTSPAPLQPHHDPTATDDRTRVTVVEHITTLISTLDRRFDSLHQEFKDAVAQRFVDAEKLSFQVARDSDLRYQQRFDSQTKALDAALAAQKEAVATAMIAAEKATSKAELSADKRFESVNEFRQTLSDQATSFMPRSEAEARLVALTEKIDDLKAASHAAAGKSAGISASWGYLVGAIGLAATVIATVLAFNN